MKIQKLLQKASLLLATLTILQVTTLQAAENCLPLNKDDVQIQTLQRISAKIIRVGIAIQNKSVGNDVVACRPLLVGIECRGARLAFRTSFHLNESFIWNLESRKCYRF